jgi:hypothetical protein
VTRPRPRALCAETSRADAEQLAATASRVDTWILLEYRGLWAHDAVDGSTLTPEVKAHLVRQRSLFPHARILFVRRTERRGGDGLLAYVARSSEGRPELRRLELERYDDLLALDFGAGREQVGVPVDHPLFLVCTHGKHDRCCAKFGRPLYDAVREQLDAEWVWQSSHVGGDRFAGNLVVLADGVYYGRVEPADSWPVLEAALAGRVHLPCYRGRSCHPFPAQAAERAVRELTGALGVHDVSVVRLERAPDGWSAVVSAAGTAYDVAVRREEGEPTHLTCSTETLRRPKRFVAGTPRARAA